MSDHPYVEFRPGDLIAAEVMNQMQSDIRHDIGTQSQAAVDAITTVPSAEDAERLSGRTLEEITEEIIERAVGEIARRSGYMRLYKILEVGQQVVIQHDLQNCPLVDLYQLDYFEVVAAEDGDDYVTWVNFFLHHESEQRIRFVPDEGETGGRRSIEIQPSSRDSQPMRIPFRELLALYQVQYNDNSSLADVENELWEKMFSPPNDFFEDQQHAHSPWFDRCCRDDRTVKNLKSRGDWDSLWVKIKPRKTVNYPTPEAAFTDLIDTPDDEVGDDNSGLLPIPAPTQIEVTHLDFNRTALTLLAPAVYSDTVLDGLTAEGTRDVETIRNQLKVMVLLRA